MATTGRRLTVLVAAFGMVGAGAWVGAGRSGAGTANVVFAPRPGPVFNDPRGRPAQQYAIMRHIERHIATSPKGSQIRVAVYSMDLDQFANRLIAAHRRGVHVKVLMDAQSVNDTWERLASVLGDDPNARSYAVLCTGGCLSPYQGDDETVPSLHSKYYLFSGGGKPTVTVSSANPTALQAEVVWNNSHTVVGDKGLYNAFVRNFTDMTRGANGAYDADYHWTYGTNPKAYFWPKAWGGSDTIVTMLDQVTCSKRYPSRVRVAMFQWTSGRVAIARRLARMASRGCRVTVIYPRDLIARSVRSTLARSRVVVHDVTYGRDSDGYARYYTHNKYLLIDGRYAGVNRRKIVLTGSANFTMTGLYYNDEVHLRILGARVHDAYLRNFHQQIIAARSTTAESRPPILRIRPEDTPDG
ncbi:MAG TPA: phospholipase D-like domain-containing protein [Thermomonospora sp.]|nr:phospholipase D-like domain-containing protein [Thermomonospora sp.]